MFSRDNNDKLKQQSFISQMTSGGGDMQSGSMISMFSPRNLVKLISTTIDDYNYKPKIYKPDITQEHQFLVTFQQYWLKIQSQYKKHVKSKTQKVGLKQKQQRNEQIQLKLKLDKIPSSYFDEHYEFFFAQKFNKLSLKRKQDEVAQYLDEIEILLWNKTSKNPQKYFNCIDNFDETINIVQNQLTKVQDYRSNCHRNLIKVSKSQLKIKQIVEKKKKLQQIMGHLQSMKKLRSVRTQSQQLPQNIDKSIQINKKLQILENIKKKQLEIGSKIVSLSKIVDNLQFYRQQIKANIYEQFYQEVVELMGKILAYDKNSWENTKVSPQMLGKQIDSNFNPLEQSRLNLTILDQSCFGANDLNSNHVFSTYSYNDQKIIYKSINSDQETLKNLVMKLSSIWQAILKFDLYDEQEINQLIMRQLVRHNVKWNKDLDEYLTKLFDEFQSKQSQKQQIMKPILEEQIQNQDDSQRSKEFSSTDQTSQQIQEPKSIFGTPKKNKYFSSITELTGINDLKNLKDLSQLKKKTLNTFKRFGNVKKIGQAIGTNTPSSPQIVSQTQSYCKKKQNQILQQIQKAKIQPQQKLSKVDTKFFLKAVKFYYEILSSLTKFIKENNKLTFFQNFLQKFHSFIEERIKYFFSLRNINQKTSVSDFLIHLNLIEYWCDVCDDVYENLSKLKSSIIDEYLTNLQKNALVHELKKSIEQSNYLPFSIASIHINTFYYVFFWSSIQQMKRQETNNMSLTIFKDQVIGPAQQENMKLLDLQNLQSQFKIIDRKIIYKKHEFYVCESFIPFIKQLEKYLQLREILTEFNSNIEQKICQVVGFYVWYNMKNINKTGGNVKPRTLKNLCVIHSNIEFLKVIFTQQLHIQNKKYGKTLDQFGQFFKSLENSITMTPYLLIEQQISIIYQDNTLSSQFQIPCKETGKILEIIKLSLQELKIYFNKEKIVKILEPTMKVIMKNYFGYLVSLGKRGLLQVQQFLPKFKQLLLNYGFKSLQNQSKQTPNDTHVFLKQLTDMQRNFKSKVSQIK